MKKLVMALAVVFSLVSATSVLAQKAKVCNGSSGAPTGQKPKILLNNLTGVTSDTTTSGSAVNK